MKFSLVPVALVVGGAAAFAPSCTRQSAPSSALHLFGGGASKSDDGKKGPGMMDQLAMFKKASEMAQKKKKLDEELAAEKFEGSAADGKVVATCKFSPAKNPMMDPNPEVNVVSFQFDDEWFESTSPEDMGAAVREAIIDGISQTNVAISDKYMALQEDLKDAMGALSGGAPPEEGAAPADA